MIRVFRIHRRENRVVISNSRIYSFLFSSCLSKARRAVACGFIQQVGVGRTDWCQLFCFLCMLLLLLGLSAPSAYADGGAPQLAYVAGTARGISIIDIAQRRVTGTIAEAGNPHTVLLSPDGHALYITQPARGQLPG